MSAESLSTLLPVGIYDLLPPEAQQEATCIEHLMHHFTSFGYDRVKPPLIEFDTSFPDRNSTDLSTSFQLLDPLSNHMLAVRSDITLQVARIASSLLGGVSRPLRLCYAGQILRVRGSQLRPERQFGQVGCELIGSSSVYADAEIIFLATTALKDIGVRHVSVDLCMPMLVTTLCRAYNLTSYQQQNVYQALNRKDPVKLAEIGGEVVSLLGRLMTLCGTTEQVLSQLVTLKLPESVAADRHHLIEVAGLIGVLCPDLTVTVDPVEVGGFSYQAGVSFTIFARDVRGELGRGGRYHLSGCREEPAVGFSLYTDTVLRAIPKMKEQRRLFLPFGTDMQTAHTLRQQGWRTTAALERVDNNHTEAQRLGCSHLFDDNTVQEVSV